MRRFPGVLVSLLLAAHVCATNTGAEENSTHRYDGDALYYAYQGDWFNALARLEAEPELARVRGLDASRIALVSRQIGPVAGSFELNYRMHQRTGRVMRDLIEGAVEDLPRNEALFHLARVYYRKDQPEKAQQTVDRIRGYVPAAIRPELAFLRANIAMALDRNAGAVTILKGLQGERGLEGFSTYNLGIALLRSGDELQGREYLDLAGRVESDDRAVLAIKDKANLVLGEKLLADNQFEPAKELFDRVRLDGPFSNRALLSSGWADALQDGYRRALVPWGVLAAREIKDKAVQEALLAVPYAYNRLGVYGAAALKYEAALDAFTREIGALDASIANIREGKFLASLARKELKRDANWNARLRELPETPETFYLLDLMASNDFQESLKNYLDLDQLREKTDAWSEDLAAFEDLIRRRRAHYQAILPAIDREFSRLEGQMRKRLEQRNRVAEHLEAMQTAPRPDLLMTADEQAMSEQVARLEKLIPLQKEHSVPRLSHRIKRLRGLLAWNVYADYDRRYGAARTHLREMDQELDALKQRHRAFTLTRQIAVEGYQGHDALLSRLRQENEAAREKVRLLIDRQGRMLEGMAMGELVRRRERLEEFRVKARFALADSYHRASKDRTKRRDAQ